MIVLVIEKHAGIASELQLSTAGIIGARRHDMDEIVVFGGGSAGMIKRLMMEHLALAITGAFRPVDGNAAVNTSKRMFRTEHHMETEPWCSCPAVFAAFQTDGRVIEYLVLIVNHGAVNPFIAHQIDRSEQLVGIGGQQDEPDIVQAIGLSEPIIHFVKRARIRSGCGKQ